MPQLNPSPWFVILSFCWFIFVTLMTPKTLSHKFSNKPDVLNMYRPKTEPWFWPWF